MMTNTIKLWDLTTGVCCSLKVACTSVDSACFSPDGWKVLLGHSSYIELYRLPQAGSAERLLSRIHSTETITERTGLFLSLANETKRLTEEKDIAGALGKLEKLRAERVFGDSLTCPTLAGEIAKYCIRGNTLVSQTRQVFASKEKVQPVCFSTDSRFILSSCASPPEIQLWDVATRECLRTFEGHTGGVNSVCFSPDRQRALSGSNDKTIRLWDTATGECLRTFNGHNSFVYSVCFSPDGQWALSGSWDWDFRLWDTATGECLRTFKGHRSAVKSVCFSPDGQRALSGSSDHTIRLWDTATGECLETFVHTFYYRHDDVYSVCFNPDGQRILSGSRDKTMTLWDTATGKCLRTFKGHTGDVYSVGFSPDGQLALSGSFDHTIKLWDVATGECIRTWEEKNSVYSVCFSPDGTKIAISVGNEILIYHLEFDLRFPGWADWDEGAQPYLDIFLKVHPKYTEADVQRFLTELQYRGYGWIRPEGVRKRLASR